MIIFSVSAVTAGDVNSTDSYVSSVESEDVISNDESDNTNTLSTNFESDLKSSSNKNSTQLTAKSTNIYYKGSYSVTLKDSTSGNVLTNKTVNFVVNNVKYTGTTNSNGVASIILSLNPGKYTSTASFAGDDEYNASANLSSTITVLATVKSSDITKYYKGSTKYTATFYNTNGGALSNTNVKITVNGKTKTVKTNNKGVASLAVDLKPGTYKVTATDPVTGYKLTTTFKILSTISASNVKKVYADSKKFKAKFYKSNGKVLANKYIKFKLKGKTYKVKTNSKGVASLSVKYLKKGTYKIISYNKDGLSQTNTIKVYKKVSTSLTSNYYTFLKSDTKTIKVKLLNSLGYAPSKGKIIKITINGKTYSKKTNANGIAKLKLPSLKTGVYTVKYTFTGSTYYKASSSTNRIAVISTKNPTLTVKSTKTFGYGAGTPLKVAVTAGGVALEKRTVKFNINGTTYTKTTDKSGIASLPINLAIGDYTVSYSVNKDSKINAKSATTTIKVKQRTPTTLNWQSGDSFKDGSRSIKVLLLDNNSKAVSGQTVKLTVNSKTYSATTASNGYATFTVSLTPGTATANVKFQGSNDYLASSTTKSITVKLSKSVSGINENNGISDLSAYLKSSSNCEVGNSKIKSLVSSLTSGLKTDSEKATAIFNYVRDTLSYNFYYNTKYGAVGTLTAKKGNCVDHSHLLVSMFRTAGLAARYVHGSCKFTSGSTYGHVWVQVLIDDTWTVADATSSKNSLGKIANWNTKTFTLKGKYASLPF